MARMVLLHHELPDGTSHYDWLIEPATFGPGAVEAAREPDDRCLISFRVGERIDRPETEQFEAQRIANHRYAYLDFEGAVPGGRGTVSRVARGEVWRASEDGGTVRIEARFEGDGLFEWVGVLNDGRWVFERGARLIYTNHGAFFIFSPPDGPNPRLTDRAIRQGFARYGGSIWIGTVIGSGRLRIRVTRQDRLPPVDPTWTMAHAISLDVSEHQVGLSGPEDSECTHVLSIPSGAYTLVVARRAQEDAESEDVELFFVPRNGSGRAQILAMNREFSESEPLEEESPPA